MFIIEWKHCMLFCNIYAAISGKIQQEIISKVGNVYLIVLNDMLDFKKSILHLIWHVGPTFWYFVYFHFSEIEFASFLECMHDHSSVENPEKELLDAFRAHDRHKQGYVNASDVRNILMNLGEKLSNREGITYAIVYIDCWNRIGGIMGSVFDSSTVDRGFEPQSGQTKFYKIGICCFSAKHAALRRKCKNWLAK